MTECLTKEQEDHRGLFNLERFHIYRPEFDRVFVVAHTLNTTTMDAPMTPPPAPTPAAVAAATATNGDDSKRSRKEAITLDEFLESEAERHKDENPLTTQCPPNVVAALKSGRLRFVQRKIPVIKPDDGNSSSKKKDPTAEENAKLTPELRELVKKALEEREQQRLKSDPTLNLSAVPAADYGRALPSYAVLDSTRTTITLVLDAIHDPRLHNLTEMGLAEGSSLISQMAKEDMNNSVAELARENIPPTLIETPLLYALLQRPSPEQKEWSVPSVMSTQRLYRYYRAIATYLKILFEDKAPEFHDKTVIPALMQVKGFADAIQEKRNAQRLSVFGARLEEHKGLKLYKTSAEMLAEIEQCSALLTDHEQGMRRRALELLNSHEAFLAQILVIPTDLCESLYTSERVPPTTLASEELRKTVSDACVEMLRVRVLLLQRPLQRKPDAETIRAMRTEVTYIQKNVDTCKPLLEYGNPNVPRASDGVAPRAYYFISGHAWAYRLDFLQKHGPKDVPSAELASNAKAAKK